MIESGKSYSKESRVQFLAHPLHYMRALASPAMGHWGTCPPPVVDFQPFNFSGHFRAAQTLTF